jgi:hypothetical protein
MDKYIAKEIRKAQLPEKISEAETLSLSNLLVTIESKITPRELKMVQEIGLAIGTVGMNLSDACLKNRITKAELDTLIIYCPEIQTYLQLKQVEYKYKLLQVVTNHATQSGDVKIAMWLLEKHYGDEYDSSLKKDIAKMNRDNPGDDVVEMAFAFVRRQNSNSMPVNQSIGDAEDRSVAKIISIDEVIK